MRALPAFLIALVLLLLPHAAWADGMGCCKDGAAGAANLGSLTILGGICLWGLARVKRRP